MMRIVLLAMVACACSKQSSRAVDVASCDLHGAGNCREYSAQNLAIGSDHLAKLCGLAKTGTFSMSPCPTANVTGRCATTEHTDIYYTIYPIPANELEMACRTSGGTFSKAP